VAVLIIDRFYVLLCVMVKPGQKNSAGPEKWLDVMPWLAQRRPDFPGYFGFSAEIWIG
jgi:hypothetical protein